MKTVQVIDDISFYHEQYAIPKGAQKRIKQLADPETLYDEDAESLYKDLVKQFPDHPEPKRLLALRYAIQEDIEDAREILEELWENEAHTPFLTSTLARVYLVQGEYDKVENLLGRKLSLTFCFPEREVFFTPEVIEYYQGVLEFLLEFGRTEEVQEVIEFVGDALSDSKFAETWYDMSDDIVINQLAGTPEARELINEVLGEPWPLFELEGLEHLRNPFYANMRDQRKQILSLDRDIVLADLHEELDEYLALVNSGQAHEADETTFHMFTVMAQFRDEQGLGYVMDVLNQPYEFLPKLNDDMFETLPMVMAELFEPAREAEKERVFDGFRQALASPLINQVSISVIGDALFFIHSRHPEFIIPIGHMFGEVLDLRKELDVQTPEENALVVWGIAALQIEGLLPQIKRMYQAGLIDEKVMGDYNKVELHVNGRFPLHPNLDFMDIETLYDYLADDLDEDNMPEGVMPRQEPLLAPDTPGRNDPCPCGSGKKYKKCCGG